VALHAYRPSLSPNGIIIVDIKKKDYRFHLFFDQWAEYIAEVWVTAGEDVSQEHRSGQGAVCPSGESLFERHGVGTVSGGGFLQAALLSELLLPEAGGERGVLLPRFDPAVSNPQSGTAFFT